LIQNDTSYREIKTFYAQSLSYSLRLLDAIAVGMLVKADKKHTKLIAQKLCALKRQQLA
jgi:hypothetical protein